MRYPHLNDTERAVLTLIERQGEADLEDILGILDPDLGMYYLPDVLDTLYAMDMIREVDIGRYVLHAVPEPA